MWPSQILLMTIHPVDYMSYSVPSAVCGVAAGQFRCLLHVGNALQLEKYDNYPGIIIDNITFLITKVILDILHSNRRWCMLQCILNLAAFTCASKGHADDMIISRKLLHSNSPGSSPGSRRTLRHSFVHPHEIGLGWTKRVWESVGCQESFREDCEAIRI